MSVPERGWKDDPGNDWAEKPLSVRITNASNQWINLGERQRLMMSKFVISAEYLEERLAKYEAPVSEKPTTDKPLIRAKLGIDDKPLPRRLWLWKNFVDGRPEYWAFDNPYPCYPNGDPFTLGEPCGYAIVKDSTQGRFDVTEEEVIAAIKRAAVSATEAIGLLRAIYINWPLHGISPELDDQIQALLARSDSTGDQDGK